MLTVLAYHHHDGIGWVFDIIARGMIYRALWAVTRGMPVWAIVGLAALACIVAIQWRRR